MDYKKYSLENLENWLYDAMSAGEASPQEIYDVIIGVVKENYYTYKQQASQAYELLALLNGNGGWEVKNMLKEQEYYDGWDPQEKNLNCNKDNSLLEYKGSTVTSVQYTEEELNAMCDKAVDDAKKDRVIKWQLSVQVDGLTGDCFVEFPDDLLEAANLKEGDYVEWIDNKNGTYTLRKVIKPLEMDEC